MLKVSIVASVLYGCVAMKMEANLGGGNQKRNVEIVVDQFDVDGNWRGDYEADGSIKLKYESLGTNIFQFDSSFDLIPA